MATARTAAPAIDTAVPRVYSMRGCSLAVGTAATRGFVCISRHLSLSLSFATAHCDGTFTRTWCVWTTQPVAPHNPADWLRRRAVVTQTSGGMSGSWQQSIVRSAACAPR